MRLEDFLDSILEDEQDYFLYPDTLQLPDRLVAAFKQLYLRGVTKKKELGYTISYNPQNRRIDISDVMYVGRSHSIRMPVHDRDFGNVHCHPGLGHVGGRAAHSPEDLAVFGKVADKPVFIAFVSSGTDTNYAMVCRREISALEMSSVWKFASSKIMQMSTATNDSLQDFFFDHCPVTPRQQLATVGCIRPRSELDRKKEKAYFEKWTGYNSKKRAPRPSGDDAHILEERMYTELKSVTPGFGRHAEQLSLDNMRAFASLCNLGFYRSEAGDASRLARCT
ncbi:MAG: hypothetical protein KAJ97_08635 [Acidobacteria bacterium]|nr:hypothetical protein [Acidobacteriota bacterium]